MDNLLEYWDVNTVGKWLLMTGFGAYEQLFKDNEVTGEVMLYADKEFVKQLGIESIGHRMALLRDINELKESQGYDDSTNNFDYEAVQQRLAELEAQMQGLTEQSARARADSNSTSKRPPMSPTTPASGQGAIKVYGHKLQNHEFEGYKTVPTQITDPCSKVLPLVMKKWKIEDDWKKYAIFMEFQGVEKCLSYDDCPLALFYQLRNSTEAPVFYLKSFRATDSLRPVAKGFNSILDAVRQSRNDLTSSQTKLFGVYDTVKSNESIDKGGPNTASQKLDIQEERAVAIYEYKAERDDELDVNIGDEFIVRDKSETGWWVVERNGATGWVPSGCLLEQSSNVDNDGSGNSGPQEGFALFDYVAVGGNELSIRKNDTLIVHKTYQHWLLAEFEGLQGWVPSCYVSVQGKEADKQAPQQASPTQLSMVDEFNTANMTRSEQLNFKDFASPSSTDVSRSGPTPLSQQQSSKSVIKQKTEVMLLSPEDNQAAESFQQFADVMSKLKELADLPDFAPELKQGPASSKLDSLLNQFDPYLNDDHTVSVSSKNDLGNRLGNLLNEITTNLSDLHDEAGQSVHGSAESLSKQDGIAATKDLAGIIQHFIEEPESIGNKYDEIMSKLKSIADENKNLTESNCKSNSDILDKTAVNVAISKTYSALTDVANMLLKEAQDGGSLQKLKSGSSSKRSLHNIDQEAISPTTPSANTIGRKQFPRESIVPTAKNPESKVEVSASSSNDSVFQTDLAYAGPVVKKGTIPYHLLTKRQDPSLDMEHLEKYLSNEDCLQYLGCTKDELSKMPTWLVAQRKKRANLY